VRGVALLAGIELNADMKKATASGEPGVLLFALIP
jgi:hypothetical protein